MEYGTKYENINEHFLGLDGDTLYIDDHNFETGVRKYASNIKLHRRSYFPGAISYSENGQRYLIDFMYPEFRKPLLLQQIDKEIMKIYNIGDIEKIEFGHYVEYLFSLKNDIEFLVKQFSGKYKETKLKFNEIISLFQRLYNFFYSKLEVGCVLHTFYQNLVDYKYYVENTIGKMLKLYQNNQNQAFQFFIQHYSNSFSLNFLSSAQKLGFTENIIEVFSEKEFLKQFRILHFQPVKILILFYILIFF